MASGRPFAYNTGSSIGGTQQVGDLAVGLPSGELTGLPSFWNGPDEDLGYVIAYSQPNGLHPTSLPEDNLALSSTYKGVDIVLSNNNQTAYQQFGYQMSVLGTTAIGATDRVMFSVLVSLAQPATLSDSHFIGIGYTSMNYQGNPYGAFPGNDGNSMGYCSDGTIWYNGDEYDSGFQTWGDDDVIDIAINNNVNGMWVRVNSGHWNNDPAQNPETNAGGIEIIGGPFYPVLCPGYEGTMIIQNKAKYGIPPGYNFLGNVTASVGFWRSKTETDEDFLDLVKNKTGQTFATGPEAKAWLNNNGYWTSYLPFPSPVLSLDAANYMSGDWIDSVGGKSFTLYNSPTRSTDNGGYFSFNAASEQHAICTSSLPNLNTWSVSVWHYYTGANTGAAPCIVTESFPGNTSNINYSLGNNNAPLSSGFFDGGWRITSLAGELQQNNWYYIVGTYDGATLKAYVNGSLISSVSYVGTPISSQGGIRLMRRWDLGDYWGGRLATVDIYDEAIGSDGISSIFNTTKSRFGL
jgi:hypothetical protein